jgi:hypothetical protein
MQNTVAQQLAAMASVGDEAALRPILNAIADRLASQAFNAGTLAIATTTQHVKTTGTVKLVAGGRHVALAAADPIYSLVAANSVAINKFNVLCLYCNSAGVVTAKMGEEAGSLAAVKYPTPPEGKAMFGIVTISAGANVFTGGTTALTGGTVTVTYTDVIGACDPSIAL